MTEQEYRELQEALTKKLHNKPYPHGGGKRGEGYEEAILAAKSILSDHYHSKWHELRYKNEKTT